MAYIATGQGPSAYWIPGASSATATGQIEKATGHLGGFAIAAALALGAIWLLPELLGPKKRKNPRRRRRGRRTLKSM